MQMDPSRSPHAQTAERSSIDVWALANLPGGLRQASYLTSTEHATQYRLIVDLLLERQQVSLTGVGEDDLAEQIARRLRDRAGPKTGARLLAELDLPARMKQLHAWDVVDAWDDRSLRPDNFLRNAARYQLTSTAAQLARAISQLGQDEAASIAATFAPAVLISQLEVMLAQLASDPAQAAQAWAAIRPTLESMANAAANWQARLASALAGAVDEDKVTSVKDTLLRYIDMWGAGVDNHSDTISAAATKLLGRDREQWRAAALVTLGVEADDDRLEAMINDYFATLATLLGWFDGTEAQAKALRRQMRDAIAPMIRGQRTLAAVGGHVSRRAELLTLAARLAGADSDAAAWRLWAAATGLFAPQHLALASPQPTGAPSFHDAQPAPVSLRLRQQGARALTGRPARMPDRSAGRTAARQQEARARVAEARVRAEILARNGQALSQWTDIDAGQLEVLLMLLTALATVQPDADGVRRASTADGLWRIRATPAPDGEPSAVLNTSEGRLVHPNLTLDFVAGAGADETSDRDDVPARATAATSGAGRRAHAAPTGAST